MYVCDVCMYVMYVCMRCMYVCDVCMYAMYVICKYVCMQERYIDMPKP